MGVSVAAAEPGDTGVTIVTATARLAQEQQRDYDRRQQGAWDSLDALSYRAWLRRTWNTLNAGLDSRQLQLSDVQTNALWESVIRDDIPSHHSDTAPLWNTHTTATTAADAWDILQAWQLDLAQCMDSLQQDYSNFARWAQEFQGRCDEEGWLDPAKLAGTLTAQLKDMRERPAELPARVKFIGFDCFSPQQNQLIEALKSVGVTVEIPLHTDAAPLSPEYRAYPDADAEWLAVAHWARERLEADPKAHLAVVLPNMRHSANALEYALRQILSPGWFNATTAHTTPPCYLPLEFPLAQHAVGAAALTALAAFDGALTTAAVSELILSPFIGDAEEESMERSRLEWWCRRHLPHQIYMTELMDKLSIHHHRYDPPPHCPLLVKRLCKLPPLLKNSDHLQLPSYWAERFTDWLRHLGWPKGYTTLNSEELRAARALRRELQHLATLDLTVRHMNATDALTWLRRRLHEQPLQVGDQDSPVRVLRVADAIEQHFDGLWFADLVESRWPPRRRPNPFLPIAVLREAGLPEASIGHVHEATEKLHQRLLTSATEVIISFSCMENGVGTEPSTLLSKESVDKAREYAKRAAEHVGSTPHDNTPAYLLHAHKPELEKFIDPHGPALATGSVCIPRSGVAVIEDQAKCPFRAFAIHRLDARDTELPEPGLGPGERGSLIHYGLCHAWQQIGSSDALRTHTPQKLQEILAQTAEKSVNKYAVGGSRTYHESLTAWLEKLLVEWFEKVERPRSTEFTIGSLEKKTTLTLGDMVLRFKADRVDQVHCEDGVRVAVIDYKSGAQSPSIRHWSEARPQAPQLPLYALAQDAEVEAVLYGRVKVDDCHFRGTCRTPPFDETDPKGRRVAAPHTLDAAFTDWGAMLASWECNLTHLADEFIAGEARVDPLPKACERCDLDSLCRIEKGISTSREGS